MIHLFYSEWSRLWQRKWIWFVVICVPGISYLVGLYGQWINKYNPPGEPLHVSAALLPVVGLSELLRIVCNVMVGIIVAAVFTEEYQGGHLRLIFIRRYSRGQIFWCKLFVLFFSILLFLILLCLSLSLVGQLKLPHEAEILFPGFTQPSPAHAILGYTVQYYALAYATLLGVCCLFVFISMYSKNVAYGIGISILYVLFGNIFDGVMFKLALLVEGHPFVYYMLGVLLLPMMQIGMFVALTGVAPMVWAMAAVLVLYCGIFTWGAYRRFVIDDYMY